MKYMKALVAHRYGSADVLEFEQLPIPSPQAGELLIRVIASTVNRTDTGVLSGKPCFARLFFGLRKPKRPIRGTEFAGVVEEVGDSRNDFKVGDRVFGFHDEGTNSHAEFITVSGREAIGLIPDGISFKMAAASSEGTFYAMNILRNLPLNDESSVLINGISGGIGSAVLQLLKQNNVTVTGVCSGDVAQQLEELGADKIYDYHKEDFRDDLENSYDFILDTVGNRSFRDCRKYLSSNGVYASTELGPWAQNVTYAIISRFTSGCRAIFPFPHDVKGCHVEISSLLANRQYVPLIDRSYPFDEITEAYRYVALGQKVGNVVIDFSTD